MGASKKRFKNASLKVFFGRQKLFRLVAHFFSEKGLKLDEKTN